MEDEQVLWDPDESDWSPNRIDWLVWAVTDLFKLGQKQKRFTSGTLVSYR